MRLGRIAFVMGVVAVGLLSGKPASAQTQIAGGSSLLTQSDADQLGVWLGEGPIKITRIFSKSQDGASSTAFHAAADGKGRTFSLWNVTHTAGSVFSGTHLVGGYNPRSWDSSSGYVITPSDSQKTAFIFDLTRGVKQSQNLAASGFASQYQTYNQASYGPTFGGGHDLHVNSSLSAGYAYGYSYNGSSPGSNSVLGTGSSNFSVGDLEVFTISAADNRALATPEPASALLLVPGLAALTALKKRKARKAA